MLWILFVVVAFCLCAIAYQAIGSVWDAKRYPPPGGMVEVDGELLHVLETGQGTPTVVLEAGLAATSLSWRPVQERIAQFAKAVSYDRAGLGWSRAARAPRTASRSVGELRNLLEEIAAPRPYILVGHSYGGYIVRQFATRYPELVAGLVLVDPIVEGDWRPLPESQRRRLQRGVSLSRRGALLARVGVVRFATGLALTGSRRLPQFFAKAASGNGAVVTARMAREVSKLPKDSWPVVRAHWSQPKSFLSMADHLENLPGSLADSTGQESLGDIPLIVLSAGDAPPAALAEQRSLAALSRRGVHRSAARSGHWILLDEPELVVQAVRDIMERDR